MPECQTQCLTLGCSWTTLKWFVAKSLSTLSVDFHPSAYICFRTSQFPRLQFILCGFLSSSFGKILISSTSRLLWGWTFHLLWKFLLSRNVTSWPDGKCEQCNRLPLRFNYISKKQFRKIDLENGLKLAPTGSRALSAEKDWKSSNVGNQGEPVPPALSPVAMSLEVGLQFGFCPLHLWPLEKAAGHLTWTFWGQVPQWQCQDKEGGNRAIRRENSSSKPRRDGEVAPFNLRRSSEGDESDRKSEVALTQSHEKKHNKKIETEANTRPCLELLGPQSQGLMGKW